MKSKWIFLLSALAAVSAQAEIYKLVDSNGHVTYSSSPMKGAKKLDLGPLPTIPAVKPASGRGASPDNFPRVDGSTQRGRDYTRRRILLDELVAEEKLLAESRQQRKSAADDADIALHERNVDALKTELANLR
jgi:hypothetical protein